MENKNIGIDNVCSKIAYRLEDWSKFSKRVSESVNRFADTFKSLSFQQLFNDVEEICKNIANELGKAPESVRIAQVELLKRGWYINGNIAFVDVKNICNMTDNEIEEMMQEYAKQSIPLVIQKAKYYFPHRYDILNDAFIAHNGGQYNLSIPVMLMQADGITNELFNVSFFKKNNNIPKTKMAKEERIQANIEKDSIVYTVLVQPLDMLSSLQVNTWDRDQRSKDDCNFGLLNRHGVLHGLDLDYGKESNSLRCIMLLSYLMDLKEQFFIADEKIL